MATRRQGASDGHDLGQGSPHPSGGLMIRYVPLSEVTLWDENPKKHDVGALWASIARYGFRDAPVYDGTLGALVAGNGRTHVARLMRDAGEPPPRGVQLSQGGEWLVPVQMGIDARDRDEARAFAIDHNHLVMSGGDFGLGDFARMWDEHGLASVLTDLAGAEAFPVTVDGADLDALITGLGNRLGAGDATWGAGGRVPAGGEGPDTDNNDEQADTVRCPACGHKFTP